MTDLPFFCCQICLSYRINSALCGDMSIGIDLNVNVLGFCGDQ